MYFDEVSLYKAFLISKEISNLNHFQNYKLNDKYNLLVSKDYQTTEIKKASSSMYLLGYCFDIRDSSISTEDILYNLLESSNFHEELEYLNGRFVIIFVRGLKVYISTDAGGLKLVFYSKQSNLVSSHEYMIKTLDQRYFNLNIKVNKEYRKGFLDQTSFENVYKLSPNNELELGSLSTKRIFPLKNKGEATVDDIIIEMSRYIDEINRWLQNQSNKKFSLTGGIDSRVSLALAKPIVEEMDFFTYLRPLEHIVNKNRYDTYSTDEKIVREIVENLRISHHFFTIYKNENDRNYYRNIRKVVSSNHSYALSKYFKDDNQFKNALHIKSTIQSIGKTSFEERLYNKNDFNTLVDGTKRWAIKKLLDEDMETDLKKSVKEFMGRTDLTFNNIYDYHVLDLLFLESRLGNFQSIITQETDNTLEIFNYFNSRKLISMLLMPKLPDRHSDKLFFSLINQYWPMLNFFGINDEVNIYTKHQRLKEKITNEKLERLNTVKIKLTSNLKIEKNINTQQFIIQPKKIPIKSEAYYSITITNKSDLHKIINIKSVYNNTDGRGIFTLIFDNKEMDIVDAFRGDYTILKPNETKDIILNVNRDRKRNSWLEAATVILEM